MEFLVPFLLFAGMLLGLASIPFGFPGAGIILGCIFIYALYTDFSGGVGVWFFVGMCVLAAVAETADNWLTMIGARRYGASAGSMWLSLIGGLLGALVLGAPLIVILGPLGPIAGGFAGAFLVVALYEYNRHRDWNQAVSAGWGSLLGRMAGIILKGVIAIAMILAVAFAMLR